MHSLPQTQFQVLTIDNGVGVCVVAYLSHTLRGAPGCCEITEVYVSVQCEAAGQIERW